MNADEPEEGQVSAEVHGLLLQLQDMTNEMQGLAKSKEWDRLLILEQDRKAVLEKLFATPMTPTDIQFVIESIKHILEIDKAIVAMGEAEQEAIISQIRRVDTGIKATQAYKTNTK